MESMRPGDTNWDVQAIQHGWDVFDADGDKVGDVSDVFAGYVTVSKGFIFTSERYIPVSAIERTAHDRVYLNVTKDEIDASGWDQMPETGVYAQPDQQPTTPRPDASGDDETLKLREERLRADKQRVQTGDVTVGKKVVTEQKNIDVPVSHEEVVVEQHPVDPTRRAESDIDAADDREIHVPVHEEQVRVEKEPVVYGEVDVHKRQVQDTQRVSGTARREEARVDRNGDNIDVDGIDGVDDLDEGRETEPPHPAS